MYKALILERHINLNPQSFNELENHKYIAATTGKMQQQLKGGVLKRLRLFCSRHRLMLRHGNNLRPIARLCATSAVKLIGDRA